MNPDLLPHVLLEADQTADAAVIWMHGLGANGHDFPPIVPELDAPETIRFIFPHAPSIPITVNNGHVMPGWYDIRDLSAIDDRADKAGVEASCKEIQSFIDDQIEQGISPSRIMLAGFSQGGAIALHCGLLNQHKLGGIIALSTYLPVPDAITADALKTNQQTPLFMAHGEMDPVVPYSLGQRSYEQIQTAGHSAQSWHSYPMPHSVHPQEVADIGNFLRTQLG